MAPDPKFVLENIIAKVRELWTKTGVMPAVNAVRTLVGGGDNARLQHGLSLVAVEYGINCKFLDSQPAEIRALITDPRGPNGVLPLDPLTCDLLPEGVLAGALTMIRAVADARLADLHELERRVNIERARADAIAHACEGRLTAAVAAQLSAEQRYAGQDAEHERDTRDLRAELAAAQKEIAMLTSRPSAELETLSKVVSNTGDEVRGVAVRLERVEQHLRHAAPVTVPATAPKAARSQTRPRAQRQPTATRKTSEQSKSA